MKFFQELRRRKIWLFGGLYLAMAWLLLEVAMALESTLELPDWFDQAALVLLVIGFPVALFLAWAQESVAPPATSGDPEAVTPAGDATALEGKRPSLVILPFTCLSDDREIEILADGLTEDLTTLLSRIPELFVIARNTANAFRGESPDLQEVAKKLGVRYALQGSARRFGDKLRISSQLIATQTGTNLWAARYDRGLDDFVEIQDELAQQMAMELCLEITRAEASLASRVGEVNEDALTCLLQAKALLLFRGWSKKSFAEAVNLCRRAIALDADFAPAHAYLALLLAIGGQAYYVTDRKAAHEEALQEAELALDLAPQSSEVLGCVGCAYSDIGFHQKGIPIIEKAIEIDATNAQAFAALGAAKIVTLDIEGGVRDLEHALKLAPGHAGNAMWKTTLSVGQSILGNQDAALDIARQACRDDPRFYAGFIALAIVLVRQGRRDEAQSAMDEAQRILPDLDRMKVRNLMGAWAEESLRDAGIEIP